MELCWDNIENIRLSNKGNFRDAVKKKTYYLKICKQCNGEFLGEGVKSIYCNKSCSNKHRKFSEETKRKISDSRKGKYDGKNAYWYGKKLSNETKEKISKSKVGKCNSPWKSVYSKKKIPLYDTYAHQLEWCEEVRRNKADPNILEVKCFKCNEWYIPKRHQISNRIQYLKGNFEVESRFYCSNSCKNSCSIFHKSINTIMKEDAVRAGRLPWIELTREVQPELRSMVLERDEYRCIKCGSEYDLQCHHILPVNIEPLLSADIDNCITLCKSSHIEAHKKDGCRLNQLHIEEC
jgi:5-methylcytosine-specific restriction endonuclease McrA